MNSTIEGDKVRNACIAAINAFKKLNKPEYSEIIARLEYCIASYDFDQNPVGLFELAMVSHHLLSEVKKNYPKKISQKLLDSLEKSAVV
jgi:hypothetical protein